MRHPVELPQREKSWWGMRIATGCSEDDLITLRIQHYPAGSYYFIDDVLILNGCIALLPDGWGHITTSDINAAGVTKSRWTNK